MLKGGSTGATLLKDYKQPDYLVDQIDLRFELEEHKTIVTAASQFVRNHKGERALVLSGQNMKLLSVSIDGQVLTDQQYTVDADELTILEVPEKFLLQVVTQLDPKGNTSLEGLYQSSGNYCTQCEAEGFRKITYYLDRPDVMAKFTTTIVADPSKCSAMLSNGNCVDQGDLEDGRRWVKWEDPFKKPCYLFALVAGNLEKIEQKFTTSSGREVTLQIFVEEENIEKCDHAMVSLIKSMQWDEQTFGLEYDLDIYMIVAVNDFNMGAMENKGLNVFNSKYVLASQETATDTDYLGIESVIAHEYFHNWTGNRVTCRDWFQLSLKEGLTVYRDQEFSADMNSRAVCRIQDVRMLRSVQFLEDGGPMSHPVRPDSYVEINNFYTATVYNKGAEVVRMYQTLLGRDGFRKGLDLYFQRHDGQAVTTDDFFSAMMDANKVKYDQFKRWYSQAGTPQVTVTSEYNKPANTYHLTITQDCKPTPGQDIKEPFLIPLKVGLLDQQGEALKLTLNGDESVKNADDCMLLLSEATETFEFINLDSEPVLSILREFSAPVKIHYQRSPSELALLMAHDPDAFCRWEAGQELASKAMVAMVKQVSAGQEMTFDDSIVDALRTLLSSWENDPALVAEMIKLPAPSYLAEQFEIIDVDAIFTAKEFFYKSVANKLFDELLAIYKACQNTGDYSLDAEQIARRELKNVCLSWLMASEQEDIITLCNTQLNEANNMTDSIAALGNLASYDSDYRQAALDAFFERWKGDPLVMDKWLMVQSLSKREGAFKDVKALLDNPVFEISNPNKVRALIGAFCHGNMQHFHASNGQGYEFACDAIETLDKLNPQVSASILKSMTRWKRYAEPQKNLMKLALERIVSLPGLSPDCTEIATKSLK